MDEGNRLLSLVIKTPRLILKIPRDGDFAGLGSIVANGIQKPEEPHFQDDGLYNKTPEDAAEELKKFVEATLTKWNKEDWQIPFAVFFENKPIGLITMYSKQFPITRGFGASYWLGLSYQGQGLGTETLQAVLYFGFKGLGAREAYCGAWADNVASLRVMEKLGFVFNGEYWMNRNGEAVKDRRMRLSQEDWQEPEGFGVDGFDSGNTMFEI